MFVLLQQADVGDDCTPPTDLKVKTEPHGLKTEPMSPESCPAEDQTEPVDLSLNKPRSLSLPQSKMSATLNPAPSGVVRQPSLSATPVPSTVQSIGSMVTTITYLLPVKWLMGEAGDHISLLLPR